MGDAFITRRGGGIKEGYALISVTFPAGSVCTCSNGSKTLRAKDTSGAFLFVIPEAGTWTVSCTDGTQTASKNVLISSQYQSESVVLAYRRYLINNGTIITQPTLGGYVASFSKSGNVATLTTDGNRLGWAKWHLNSGIDDYTSLVMDVSSGGRSWSGGQTPGIGISLSDPNIDTYYGTVSPYATYTQLLTSGSSAAITAKQYKVDFNNEYSDVYIWIVISGGSGIGTGIVPITNLYLE